MEPSLTSSDVAIATPEQCRILLSSDYKDVIKRLLTRPHSLKELVDDLNLSMDRVYYRVKQLEAIGLVKVVSEERRPGKPIKRYAMTAKSYELPFSNTSSATLDELILGQMMERQETFGKYLMENLIGKGGVGATGPSLLVTLQKGTLVVDLKADETLEGDSK
ncbi:hypothetical protein GCM10017783_19630 [Deinococcus piscis]|uniref:Uncharacterized protein n=1 Tax=Deinococcus piscis TaxID=394230 RepID=A0ABQ3KAB8_9DEIO|nr:hypothetical protein [Deinococcus piscis]GHG07101.1 hypothetical protein GCM10017783_19630 [Deinococcus piscis]